MKLKKLMIGVVSFYFLIFNIVLGDNYLPKNNNEKAILEKLRKRKIVIGTYDRAFYNKKSLSNNLSINDIIEELFNDYLGLNATFKQGAFHNLLGDIKSGTIQGIAPINKQESRNSIFAFSTPLYTGSLYIVSSKKKLYSLNDLEGEDIYISSKYLFKVFLETILYNNNIEANIVEVDDIFQYEDEFILTNIPVQFDPKYITKISNSSSGAIGLSHDISELLPILNNALTIRYREKISQQIEIIKKEVALENFYSSLNQEELNYISEYKGINLIYEKDFSSELYYYSSIKGKTMGIVPNIVENIDELVNIKVTDLRISSSKQFDVTDPDNIYILSKTRMRDNNFIFSDKFYDIPTYKVALKSSPTNPSGSVGVVSSSIEEEIECKYTLQKNIKRYPDYSSLVNALNTGKVEKILTTNTSQLNHNLHYIVHFEDIPISLAVPKNNPILRDVINKALSKMVILDDIISSASLEKTTYDTLILNRENHKKWFFIFVSLSLGIMLIYSFIRVYNERLSKLQLLKDPLSGLPNRVVFNEFCSTQAQIEGYVFVLGIDSFKKTGTLYYYNIGDKAIEELSKFLRSAFLSSQLFKVSTEEFHGIFNGDPKELISILKTYIHHCPTLEKHGLTFSLGIYKKPSNISLEDAFSYAHMAFFEARKTKGISYHIATESFIDSKKREVEILSLLNGNLEEIFPVFQPKIDLVTGRVIGAEALARLSSKKLGIVSPLEFIQIAENYNLVYKIDYIIANKSIELIRKLLDNGEVPEDFRISFNLSPNTFYRIDLIEVIQKALKKYSVPGKYLEAEITETVVIKDRGNIINKLNNLIDLGIQISLDDFTAGHSTAGLLPLLPIDVVKFDKSLLDSFYQNQDKAEIIYLKLISLTKDLDLKIVAEGIETRKELEFLKKHGVDYGQGYLIGKPEIRLDLTPLSSKGLL